MAVALGKRKRTPATKPQQHPQLEAPASDSEDLQEVFRRHFEAKFAPLSATNKPHKDTQAGELEVSSSDEDADVRSWDGLSILSDSSSDSNDAQEDDDEDTESSATRTTTIATTTAPETRAEVEVIQYARPTRPERPSKALLKAFMSSRPPAHTAPGHTSARGRDKSKNEDADDDDATNAAHDADLQKLLRESHLLSAASKQPDAHRHDGHHHQPGQQGGRRERAADSTRHAALDLHLRSLGAKPDMGLKHQRKMPMGMRRGMQRARAEGEAARREEARRLGVVLEREVRVKKSEGTRRERGVGGPSVGRFRGGTLTLSGRDVRNITGGGGRGRGRR